MKSKRAHEAYVLIDHSNSPGITAEFVHQNKLDVPIVGAGMTFESAMAVCSHCCANVVLNPDRSRPREWCWKCDAYVCDPCAAAMKSGAMHEPYRKKLDDAYDALTKL